MGLASLGDHAWRRETGVSASLSGRNPLKTRIIVPSHAHASGFIVGKFYKDVLPPGRQRPERPRSVSQADATTLC